MKRNTSKITLTPKQEAWLVKHFCHRKNEECARHLGISPRSVVRLARSLGLSKTSRFLAKCQRSAAEAAQRSHLLNGTYPPKGFIIPRSEENRFKPGVTSRERLGARKERARVQKSAESRRETMRKERIRVKWGLEQKTNLRIVAQTRRHITLRNYLKGRGYIIDDEDRKAYYTDETRRGKVVEQRLAPYYTAEPYE